MTDEQPASQEVTAVSPDAEPSPTEPKAEEKGEPEANAKAEAEPQPEAEEQAETRSEPEAKAKGEQKSKAKGKGRSRRKARAKGKAKAGEGAAPHQLRVAFDQDADVTGRVIGWNDGGFHVVVDGFAAFCPRSEMELGAVGEPREYVDQELEFRVIEIRRGGRRVVLSRAAALRGGRETKRRAATEELAVGTVVEGTVASITDFGAFIELGGVQGLVHISELSRGRVEHPSDVLEVGDSVEVKVLKIEQSGRRISLSRKALEPDPWKDMAERFREGAVVTGVVEKTERFGVLIQLEPGLTGLLPASEMSLPRDTSPMRAFPTGREVEVQIMAIDPRRRRISLAPKGTQLGGSRSDVEDYKKSAATDMGSGFNALEAAFRKSKSP